MAKGFFEGVNTKKLIIGIVVMWVYIFGSDFLIHHVLMGDMYKATTGVFRPEADMKAHMGCMMLSQVVMAIGWMLVFVKGYQKKGWMEGVRFGLLMWILALANIFMQDAVYPVSHTLVAWWCGTMLVQAVVGGVVTSAVYKK